jgi:hypothetical protein
MRPNPRWTREELERSWTSMQREKDRMRRALEDVLRHVRGSGSTAERVAIEALYPAAENRSEGSE